MWIKIKVTDPRFVLGYVKQRWYNSHRRHSSIAYHAPIAYEKLHQEQA